MKTFFSALLLTAAALTGCSQNVASRDPHKPSVAYVARPDYFKDRRTVTGSNIPTPKDELPPSNVFATSPSQSFAREHPSLYPTEPVVGATKNSEPGTEVPNVGAGPAGSNPVPSTN